MSSFSSLPIELLVLICSFLSYEDLYLLRLTSRSFHSLSLISRKDKMCEFNKEVEVIAGESFKKKENKQLKKIFCKIIFFNCLGISLQEHIGKKIFKENTNELKRGASEEDIALHGIFKEIRKLFETMTDRFSRSFFGCSFPYLLRKIKEGKEINKLFKSLEGCSLKLGEEFALNRQDKIICNNYCRSLFEFFDSLGNEDECIDGIKLRLNVFVTYPLDEEIFCKEEFIYSQAKDGKDFLSFKFLPKDEHFSMKQLYLIMMECEKLQSLKGTYLTAKGISWEGEEEIEFEGVQSIHIPGEKIKEWRKWMREHKDFNKQLIQSPYERFRLSGKFCEVLPKGQITIRRFVDLMRVFKSMGHTIISTKNFVLYGKRVRLLPNITHIPIHLSKIIKPLIRSKSFY